MKWFKKLLAVLVLLVIVIVIAAIGLVIFIDPNKLKPIVIEEVKARTGYELLIDGELSWSFYPRLGVKIEHMTLRAPQQAAPFVDLRDVRIATELLQIVRAQGKLRGNIHISNIVFMNLHAHDADVKIGWEESMLIIHSLRAALYEGSLTATARGRQLSTIPQWDWDAQLDGVQLKPLLEDVNGRDSKLKVSGTAQINLQGETQGVTRDQMLNNLNGDAKFGLDNGVVDGVDVNYFLIAADALINKKPMPATVNTNETVFTRLTGSATIKNGVATTNNLLLTSPTFITKGMGQFYLVSQTINIELQIKSQEALRTQWEIPVLVTGAITKPDVRLDVAGVEKLIAKTELEKIKTKANEIINKHVPGKAGEYLQNLIGK